MDNEFGAFGVVIMLGFAYLLYIGGYYTLRLGWFGRIGCYLLVSLYCAGFNDAVAQVGATYQSFSVKFVLFLYAFIPLWIFMLPLLIEKITGKRQINPFKGVFLLIGKGGNCILNIAIAPFKLIYLILAAPFKVKGHWLDDRVQRKAIGKRPKDEAKEREKQRKHELKLAKLEAKARVREQKDREKTESDRRKHQEAECRWHSTNNNHQPPPPTKLKGCKPDTPTGKPIFKVIKACVIMIRQTTIKGAQYANYMYTAWNEQAEKGKEQGCIEENRGRSKPIKPKETPKRLPESERIATLNGGKNKIYLYRDRHKKGNEENIYKVLEVCRGDNFGEIKNSFHRLGRQYHPDLFADLGNKYTGIAAEIFKAINASFDEIKRKYGEK